MFFFFKVSDPDVFTNVFLRGVQVALLLPRPSEQRQPPALRDHSGVWAQFAEVHLHRDAPTAAGEVQGGEGQTAPRETHTHPHTLPQVRRLLSPLACPCVAAVLYFKMFISGWRQVFVHAGGGNLRRELTHMGGRLHHAGV